MTRSRVARRFYAAYLNVNDIVTYGKYKNHRGKIVSFGQDKWGNPTIEIEPIPKGRKQNKVMGLFKVWRADVKEKAMEKLEEEKGKKKEAMSPKSVVARYLTATGIPLGKTFDVGNIRIHRYRDVYFIWDLTNAGKRGKKVRLLTVSPMVPGRNGDEMWMENMSKILPTYRDFDAVKKLFKDLLVDYPGEIRMSEREERGIDVDPVASKLTLKTDTGIEIKAETKEFLVNHHQPMTHPVTGKPNGFQDTLYYSRDKKSAMVFFMWLQENLSLVNKMAMNDLRAIWDKLDVKYDYH